MYSSRWAPWKPGAMKAVVCGAKIARSPAAIAITTTA